MECSRYAILSGNFLDSVTAYDLGLLTHNVDPSEVDSVVSSLIGTKPENKYAFHPVNDVSEVVDFSKKFYSDANIGALLAGEIPSGFDSDDPMVSRQIKSLSRGAPIALRIASELLSYATNGSSLEDGLKLELERLEEIFGTSDAEEGLSALIEGRRPNYNSS